LMLQQDSPQDYVVATGEQHSVREFADAAFSRLGLDYRNYVRVDKEFLRPADIETLLGDASRARSQLGWSCSLGFHDLVNEMVDADLHGLKTGGRFKG